MTGAPLAIPPDLAWSCLGCGRSCQDWSEVEIDAATAERLARLPLFHPRLPSREPRLPSVAGHRVPGQVLLRFEPAEPGATRCVFLDRDRRCAVHAVHGPQAKPVACRSFPFLFVDTPQGTLAAVSFACTALVHGTGEPLGAQRAAIEHLEGIATHRERRGFGLLLLPGEPLPWARYAAIAADLEALLEGARDVRAGLLAQARRLREAASLPPLDPRPSAVLRDHTLDWLIEASGTPPRFRPPAGGLDPPDPEALLGRWVRHRLWRQDLLRGGELLFGHGLLVAEVALAVRWSRVQPGGMAEAVAQVERGLALHSDLVARLEADAGARKRASRLVRSPRYAASLLAPEAADLDP